MEGAESGAEVVTGAGDTMNELVANAQRINSLLSEISTAASEQSAGVAGQEVQLITIIVGFSTA